jgi:Trypsin-like peptidase domain
MFVFRKLFIISFCLTCFLSNIFVNSVDANKINISSELFDRDPPQLPKVIVVEIMVETIDRGKILAGSGLLVMGKTREIEPNTNLIQPQIYQKYEYRVISNQHVVDDLYNNYFVRFNGEVIPIYDLYTTRRNSNDDLSYDLSLLKFSSDLYPLNLPFTQFISPGKIDGVKFSANGWVEILGENKIELKQVNNIYNVRQDERRFYYSKNTPTEDGMSGGALISSDGKLIGIHRGKDQGIPIDTVYKFYQAYLRQYNENIQSPCFSQATTRCKKSFVEM